MTEHLHELESRPSRTTLEILASVLGKLDNEPFSSPKERATRFAALLSLEGLGVYPSVPAFPERAIR
jgi:hypothetical protein